MLSTKKSSFESFLEPLVTSFSGVDPNVITLLGSIPPLLFFVFVLLHHYLWALIVFLGSAIDFLDGMVARKFKRVTAFGGFLDSVLDRVSDFFVISAFGFGGIVRWEIVVVLLFVSFLVSYTRSRGELASEKKQVFSVGLIERTERLVLLFFALLLYLVVPAISFGGFSMVEWLFIILIILSAYTIIQRVLYAFKHLK